MSNYADLVKSLRNGQEYDYESGDMINCDSTLTEASDAIETLITLNAELLEALKSCWDLGIDKTLVPTVKDVIAKATEGNEK